MPRSKGATWGGNIKARRLELDITQEELAELAGLSQQAISRIERDDLIPSEQAAARIAEALASTVELIDP